MRAPRLVPYHATFEGPADHGPSGCPPVAGNSRSATVHALAAGGQMSP